MKKLIRQECVPRLNNGYYKCDIFHHGENRRQSEVTWFLGIGADFIKAIKAAHTESQGTRRESLILEKAGVTKCVEGRSHLKAELPVFAKATLWQAG